MDKFLKLRNKDKKLVAGLMSGTSLDGIDCALVEIQGNGLDTEVKLIQYYNKNMSQKLRDDILKACSIEGSSVDLICKLNFQIGEELAKAVIETCQLANIPLSQLDLIGSHGQTIYHIPQNSTLQIGEPSIIAQRTGVVTIADFRTKDVAAGGHGAPLVPYTEYLLYRQNNKNIALQNIGGIGNVTVIPKNSSIDDIYAFDTGPGNMIIDFVVGEITNGKMKYDRNGLLAKEGHVNQLLIRELMNNSYIKKVPPKTTGREQFGTDFGKLVLNKYRELGIDDIDILTTITYFTAKSIAESYKKWILPICPLDEVIIGGGGSYNTTLVKMLQDELKGIKVFRQEDLGYSSDAKEAIAFAILANEAIHGNCNNVPNVTGAKNKVIMGNIII